MEYDERDTEPAPWDPKLAYEELSAKLGEMVAALNENSALIRAGYKDIGDLKAFQDNAERRIGKLEDDLRDLKKTLRPGPVNGATLDG
jgi:hypothetical protein